MLTYTGILPEKKGWYFTRRNLPGKPERVVYVRRVRKYHHSLKKFVMVWIMSETKTGDGPIIEELNQPDRLWAGPIEEPQK